MALAGPPRRPGRDGGEAAVARAGVDDVALVLGHQESDEGPDAVDHPQHVDVDPPPPVGQVVLPHVALGDGAGAGVVAHHVDGAVHLDRRRRPALDRSEVGDVGDDAGWRRCPPWRLVDGPVQRIGQHVGQHHLHAFLAEAPPRWRSRSPRSSGHHHHLVPKLQRHPPVSLPWSHIPSQGSHYATTRFCEVTRPSPQTDRVIALFEMLAADPRRGLSLAEVSRRWVCTRPLATPC